MKRFRFALTIAGALLSLPLIAPTASAAPPPSDPEPGFTPMIIDGQLATDAPWAARLFRDGSQFCTATIIAPRYILTAKHCFDVPATYTFRIGSLDQTSGGTLATAVEVSSHPVADLAVAKLDRGVAATYARLGRVSDVQRRDTVQIYGWGATCTDQPEINCQSQFLKVADVRVQTLDGEDAFGGIAIGARRIDGIAAGGDSGGPMFSDGKQVGIASTSDRDRRTFYTNVTRYRAFIRSVAGV
ncbi:MAG TPA: trypsin-like serine protease [Actinophytocola sp.]|uniref:S1 family peptidase n=1 Tax=Actinophytocola sp. TaxID=1872138 RepID=UPI002DBD896E|nr:trypsin-like serine protease [Actinophytocola sp.]HEU5474658.1 trypsin-like serine protease [Actinophytocola sp.]